MTFPTIDDRDEVTRLAEVLRPALLRVSRRLRREAQMAGVSVLDAQLLAVIQKHPGIGATELADREQMTRPSMSGHVKRLAASGWLSREAEARDGRRVGLALTEEGTRALDAIRVRRNDWLAQRLAAIGPEARAILAAAAEPLERMAGV